MKSITLKNNNQQIKLLNFLNDSLDVLRSYNIGAMKVKGKWVWTDSIKEIKIPLMWHKNQPDNWEGIENCLSVVKDNSTRFNDMICLKLIGSPLYVERVHTLCEKFIIDRA